MHAIDRRAFLLHSSRLALALGLAPPRLSAQDDAAQDEAARFDFGELEPLVALMTETPADALVPLLVEQLRAGTRLQELFAAGALANARAFCGTDYEGYHAAMALPPAYRMSLELRGDARALPLLKVLVRNSARIRTSGATDELGAPAAAARADAKALQRAVHRLDRDEAREALGALCRESTGAAFEGLLPIVWEEPDVHRVVLAGRMLESEELAGGRHGEALLRQSLRYCLDSEARRQRQGESFPLREVVPELLEEYELPARMSAERRASTPELGDWAETFFRAEREAAAREAAILLADGVAPEDVGEALSLAAKRLLLHDPGLAKAQSYGRGVGSVHGASVGLHASDAARAWRDIAAAVEGRARAACLIAGAYHTAGQSDRVGDEPFPVGDERKALSGERPEALLAELRAAIAAGDQARAMAAAELHSVRGAPDEPLLALLLSASVEADGALHAEKFWFTSRRDHAQSRPRFRRTHLVALARVCASQSGTPAPGLDEARRLLG